MIFSNKTNLEIVLVYHLFIWNLYLNLFRSNGSLSRGEAPCYKRRRSPSISLSNMKWNKHKHKDKKKVDKQEQDEERIWYQTSAITAFISFSALSILSKLPINSTDLVAQWGSASASLVIWIFAPELYCRYRIVSPAFPISTPTCA